MHSQSSYFRFSCCFVIVGVVYFLAASAAQSDTMRHAAPRWEHIALTHEDADVGADGDLAKRIIQLGDKGWELVSVSTVVKDGTTKKTNFFFKRPK